MKIKKAEFLRSASNQNEFPPTLYPEFVLVGRSNVGKSSLINNLVGQKKLAATSNTPGKTRALYFYLVNNQFSFVDLPGYGYAKVSRRLISQWAPLIQEYLSSRENLVLIIQVVDLRHLPSREDKQMADFIHHFSFPSLVVATKADKVPRGKRMKHKEAIARELQVAPEGVFLFSAQTGEGRDMLWKEIQSSLEK